MVVSERLDGDFNVDRVDPEVLDRRRRALVDLPWTMPLERHGVEVIEVSGPGEGDRAIGDVIATSLPGCVLGVWVGDCAPVVLAGSGGRLVVAHAGWRGIAAGVLDVAVAAVGADEPSTEVTAYLGPCVGPCCYEFGLDDLDTVAAAVGVGAAAVRGVDRDGRPSLDVRAAVVAALARHGIEVHVDPVCTGCDLRYFSHRVRAEPERHVVAAWLEVA